MAGPEVSVGAVVGMDAHPTAAMMAAQKGTPRSNEIFKRVQFIRLGTLASGTVSWTIG